MPTPLNHGFKAERLPRNVRVLGLASLINDVASEMVYPLLPRFFAEVLGGNARLLGLMEGLAETAASLLKLGSGAWSDRLRRRKTWVVVGYVLAAVARPLGGLATWPSQLMAVRVVDRIGKGIRGAPRDALVVDSVAPERRGRAFGFQRAMDHLGAAIGPLLAVFFLWQWPDALRPLFLLTAVPGVILVALVTIGLSEPARRQLPQTESPQPRGKVPAGSGATQLGNSFMLYLAAVVLFTLANASDTFLLLRAGEIGINAWRIPLLWCLFHVAKSAGSLAIGPAVDRYGGRVPVIAGWLIYAAVYLAFAGASTSWHVWLLFFCYAVFYALTEPAERALVAQFAPADRRGLAFGWFHLATGIANLPANVLFGVLYTAYGPLVAFGVSATFALAAACLLSLVRIPAAASQSQP
ncbi:MAG: MFS transporter [Pirellulales bacterium]|nr:MFS transporter [Pirellulales bacterium]